MLLLDEPLGALDLKLRKQMQVELKRIQQEVGITFIYVTHDQEEAMTMSDRIAVMNKGRYEQLGDPEGLYERPTTRFVAGFLGISNLLPATSTARPTATRSRRSPTTPRVRVPSGLVNGHDRRSRSASGPRRSALHKADADVPAGAERSSRDGRRRVVPRGVDVVPGRGATGARLTVYEQNVERTVHGSLHRPGDAVRLSWSPDHTLRGRGRPSRRRTRRRPDRLASTPETEETMNDTQIRASTSRISRRRFLQGTALAGFGAFLAACGTSGTGRTRRAASQRGPHRSVRRSRAAPPHRGRSRRRRS